MNKYTLNNIDLITKNLTKATALTLSLLISLPSYAQVDLPHVTVTSDPLPPGDWGLIGGGSQDPGANCNHIGCGDTTGQDDDGSSEDEEELDIGCISSTQQIGPLTVSQVESYQNIAGALDGAIMGLAGIGAGSIAAALSAPHIAQAVYGVVVSTIADIFLNSPANYWCGQITRIRSTICYGADIDQLEGNIEYSDFLGDYISNTETSISTGTCIDDRNLGNGDF